MRTYRVLLLAMSGVRVKDDELRRLGMTLPGFIERGRVIASLPSLGLLTLAAHTPEHWEIEYREIDDIAGDPATQIAQEGFDVVAISALTARILDAYAIADRLRECGVPVILGGLHVSALPQEALAHADVVVQGEGEFLWPEVLSDFETGELRRLYSSLHAPRRFDLAHAQVPRYDLLDVNRYNRLTLQTTRGCPLDCSFCAASRLISPYKMKPLDRIRVELEAILEIWPTPFIELADDNTFVSRKWALGLARLLAQYPIRWFTETDLSVADDDELLEALAESGCAQLLIGLESVDPVALDHADSRYWKQQQCHDYVAKIRKIQSHGITVNGCFIFGFDHDDGRVFERTKEFVHDSGLSEVQITILTPFPGTQLYERLKSEGRLLRPVFWDACTLFDVTFQPKLMSVSELEDRFRSLMLDLYNPDESARRKTIRKNATAGRRQRASPTACHESCQKEVAIMPSHASLPVFRSVLRVLTFRATREELLSVDHRHLALGLFSTWIVGVGRYWDAPDPTLFERLGVGSLLFVFAFSFLIWLLVLPLKPQHGSYRRLLTFLALVSPPAILYAIPVERMFDPATAQSLNVCFLGLVSVWRVSLLGFYFGSLVGLPRGAAVVAALLPVLSVMISLAAVGVQHRVFSEMARLPPDSDGPAAFAWAIEVVTRSVIVLFAPLLAAYFLLGRARWAVLNCRCRYMAPIPAVVAQE